MPRARAKPQHSKPPKPQRPWLRVAAWALCVACLGAIGTGLTERLAPTSILVPGSPAARADAALKREFGESISVTFLLRGPAAEIDRQGPRLLAALRREEGDVHLMSPWNRAGPDPGVLRPRPDAALIVAGFRRPDSEAMSVVVPTAKRLVAETIEPPVRAHVGGVAAIATALQENALKATHQAELIAAPILIVVLLLVFRTPLAAAIPLLVGAATVVASRGLLFAATFVMPVNALAVAMASMMGLALGVDYALLMVSRYRQERDGGAPLEVAIATAASAAGRTIVFAGATLGLAMITAALVAPGDLLGSVAAGVAVATGLSILLGVSLIPALIRILGPNLDRWRLPSLRRGPQLVDRAQRLVARPWLAIPLIALPIAAVALPAHALSIGPPDPRQLPRDDPTRHGFAELRKVIGPGWAAPIVISATARSGPITEPDRLEALARWQRRLARDPAVAAVVGPDALAPAQRLAARGKRAYRAAPRRLAQAQRRLEALRDGLGAAKAGVDELREGLAEAAAGADSLAAGGREAEAGAGRLERGLRRASAGAQRLERGLRSAVAGSRRLAAGQRRLSRGADRLARGLRRLEASLVGALGELGPMFEQLRAWADWLRSVREPAAQLARQIDRALEALDELPLGPGDPGYAELREALERAAGLVGLPLPDKPPLDLEGVSSLAEALERIETELGRQLEALEALPNRLDELLAGVRRLRRGSERLAAGTRRARRGSARLEQGLRRLAEGGGRLADGLAAGPAGAAELARGLGRLGGGAERLAAELADGHRRSEPLSEGLARPDEPLRRYALVLHGYRDAYRRLDRRLPGAIDSGYLLLTGLDGTRPQVREQLTQLVSIDRGGRSVRMLVVPAAGPGSPATRDLSERLLAQLPRLERASDTEAEIGEGAQSLADYTNASLKRLPWLVLALCTVAVIMLTAILRSLLLPLVAVALNLLTIAAAFGALETLFDLDLLVGPPYIDAISAAGVLTIMFVLAIDYEVFLLTRMREIWLEGRDHTRAINEGLRHTAGVITGAAVIMSSVFLAFATADIASLQQFGAGLTIAVALDATVVRLVLLPALMRALGPRAWWLPGWLDRRLPVLDHGPGPAIRPSEAAPASAGQKVAAAAGERPSATPEPAADGQRPSRAPEPAAADRRQPPNGPGDARGRPRSPAAPQPAATARLQRIADAEHNELLELLARARRAAAQGRPGRLAALAAKAREQAEPHFRYEQRALFPHLVDALGAARVGQLYTAQDQALDALRRVVELARSRPAEALTPEADELLRRASKSIASCHALSGLLGEQPPELAELVLKTRSEVLTQAGER